MLDTNYNNKQNKNKRRIVNFTAKLKLIEDDVIIYAWKHCQITASLSPTPLLNQSLV